jgi:Na+/melibiose symporter-like transporter
VYLLSFPLLALNAFRASDLRRIRRGKSTRLAYAARPANSRWETNGTFLRNPHSVDLQDTQHGAMNDASAVAPTVSRPPARQSFAALRHSGYRAQFVTYFLAMMADNIEHVISYWVVFQKFHSPALAGFAVLSHWLPFLLFSVASGALADRFDPRRLIQCGMGLFILASLGWGYFFLTDTIEVWHAMVLLLIHGCAGVLWATPGQVRRAISASWSARRWAAQSRSGLHTESYSTPYSICAVVGECALWSALPQRRRVT